MENIADVMKQAVEDAMATVMTKMTDMHDEHLLQLNSIDARMSLMEAEKLLDDEELSKQDVKPVKAGRRSTIFMRDVEDNAHSAERRQVVMNMPTPDWKHIYLSSTSLGDYARFVIKWFEFEEKNGIKLEPAQIVSKDVRNILIYNNQMSDREFSKLGPTEFNKFMAKETVVLTKVEFANTLKDALKGTKVLEWADVKPNTHEKFFHGILHRKELYFKIFNIIMESNKEFCPSIEGREFGLARIFLDLISNDYNTTVLAEIPRIRESNYAKLEDFLNTYVKMAKEHYDMSRKIRLIPYKGSDFKPVERVFNKFVKGSTSTTTSSLHHVESQEFGFQDELQDFIPNRDPDSDDSMEEEVPATSVADTLQAIENSSQERGCVNYAIYGNCFKAAECKNVSGHNEAVAKRTRAWLITKLTTQNTSSNSTNNYPPRIVQRDK
jgi:hypothetical protein